ncbi:MAG: ATP phosphoribosyltransferase [Chloroflexi bacterium]|nr:ATP phosphoribosyltransferase [Chloroflexota bacterium]
MEEATLDFLKSCGLRVNRTNPRQYNATIPSLAGVQVLFQRANDIFSKVDEGSIDLGITGYDIVREHAMEDDSTVMLIPGLGYGHCALVLAVPEGWIDATSVADLAQISADLRSRGRELRVATKYPNLTRQFLYDHGINYFHIVESSGAMEAAPSLGYADLICDLTSSGVTLRENRLKTLVGGTIVRSQACLIGNRPLLRDSPEKLEKTRAFMELIEAHMRSRDYFSITANIRADSPEAVARRVTAHSEVAGLRGPTIARVYPKAGGDEGWYAVTVIVASELLLAAVDAMRKAGASDLTTVAVRYVFDSKCWSFEALRRHLAGEAVEEAAAWP